MLLSRTFWRSKNFPLYFVSRNRILTTCILLCWMTKTIDPFDFYVVMHENLWVIHWQHEYWLSFWNNNRNTIHIVFNGTRIYNRNQRTNAKNTIVYSIDKSITENSIWCRILNDTKQTICLVCVCFRTKMKENKNSMVMTTWSQLHFWTFVERACIWFLFLHRSNDSHQLTDQHH